MAKQLIESSASGTDVATPSSKPAKIREYFVWTADFFDSPSRMFPRDEDVIGRFKAGSVVELRKQLKDAGHTVSQCRWERVEPRRPRSSARRVVVPFAPRQHEEHPMSANTTHTAPERIWLQVNTDAGTNEDGSVEGSEEAFPYGEELTWHSGQIGGLEVEYVRADLVRAALPVNAGDEGDPQLQRLAALLGVRA